MDENASRHTKPRIGRRLLGRQAAVTRASGLRLGRAVAGRHERPEPVRAAMRLVPKRAGVARCGGAAAAAPAAPAEGMGAVGDREHDHAGHLRLGLGVAVRRRAARRYRTGSPFMGGAEHKPRTPEQKRVSRIKRGGPEVARAAKILEGDDAAARSGGGGGEACRRGGAAGDSCGRAARAGGAASSGRAGTSAPASSAEPARQRRASAAEPGASGPPAPVSGAGVPAAGSGERAPAEPAPAPPAAGGGLRPSRARQRRRHRPSRARRRRRHR